MKCIKISEMTLYTGIIIWYHYIYGNSIWTIMETEGVRTPVSLIEFQRKRVTAGV